MVSPALVAIVTALIRLLYAGCSLLVGRSFCWVDSVVLCCLLVLPSSTASDLSRVGVGRGVLLTCVGEVAIGDVALGSLLLRAAFAGASAPELVVRLLSPVCVAALVPGCAVGLIGTGMAIVVLVFSCGVADFGVRHGGALTTSSSCTSASSDCSCSDHLLVNAYQRLTCC